MSYNDSRSTILGSLEISVCLELEVNTVLLISLRLNDTTREIEESSLLKFPTKISETNRHCVNLPVGLILYILGLYIFYVLY